MTSYHKIFNNHFIEMCKDIEYIFEGDWNITKVVNFFELLVKTKPRLIFDYFKHYESIYHEELKDDPYFFFIQHEYSEDLKRENSSSLLEPIETFKKQLQTTSDTNKEKIREYLKNLRQILILDKQNETSSSSLSSSFSSSNTPNSI